MARAKENRWLCFYVYTQPPFENIIVNCLFPIADLLKRKKIIKKWFFIRYYEDGMHIRFRLLFINADERKGFNSLIRKKIEAFIIQNEMESSSITGEYVFNKNYEPEYERYGGTDGMLLSEGLFFASSNAIANLIKLNGTWSYNCGIINAGILNYIMMFNLLKKKEDLLSFFLFNYNNWLPYASLKVGENVMLYYDQKFGKIKEVFFPLVENLHNQLIKEEIFNNIYMQWKRDVLDLSSKLNKMNENNKISSSKFNDGNKEDLWPIFDSYVHMNNNRFGINNQDESFISRMLCDFIERNTNV